MLGELIGKVRSTPTPEAILLTVKDFPGTI